MGTVSIGRDLNMLLSIVIPVYNKEEAIPALMALQPVVEGLDCEYDHCSLDIAAGDAVVVIDADLQDRPN
jgi:hypothetical protein